MPGHRKWHNIKRINITKEARKIKNVLVKKEYKKGVWDMKTYKGYELMKLVSEGKVSFNQKVSTTNFEYENCTIDFVIKDRAENIMDLDFELIEDEIDIESIEEININDRFYRTDNINKLNELVQAVKQLDKKIKEKE